MEGLVSVYQRVHNAWKLKDTFSSGVLYGTRHHVETCRFVLSVRETTFEFSLSFLECRFNMMASADLDVFISVLICLYTLCPHVYLTFLSSEISLYTLSACRSIAFFFVSPSIFLSVWQMPDCPSACLSI